MGQINQDPLESILEGSGWIKSEVVVVIEKPKRKWWQFWKK